MLLFRKMLRERATDGKWFYVAEFHSGDKQMMGDAAEAARRVGWHIQASWQNGEAVFFMFARRAGRMRPGDDE